MRQPGIWPVARGAVFVGEVVKAVRLGGLFQPVDEVLAQSGLASATRSSRRG